MKKIVDILNLGGSMPLEGHSGVRFGHAFSIIYHLYQRFPGILNKQTDIRSAGIYRILEQLFHGAGRSLNNLTRRDLVGDVIG